MLTEYQIGKEMFAFIKAKSFQSDLNKFFKNLLLRFSTNNPRLQQQLFRFVDVLPSLKTTDQVNQLLVEYLGGTKTFIAPIVNFSAKLPLLDSITHKVINFSAQTMAKSFIAGSNTSEALDKISQLERQGLSYTLDLLGEIALTEEEASLYHEKYLEIIRSIDQVNLSIKLSSLAAQIHPLDFKSKKQIIKNRLRDIYKLAIETGASINVDSEHFHFKEITFEILEELLSEPDFINWTGAGIVIQAYLKDSYMDLVRWINIAKSRRNPITIRLVKGAYWDYEVAIARQKSWDCPVYEFKSDTDANYEKLTEVLLQNHHYVRPAIASHNIRSLAHAIRIAQVNEVPQTAFEIQMLYGMLDELKGYFPENNFCLRVYLPYGELIPGMSYLVRRLLENTANDSFLKQGFLNKSSEDELLLEPHFSQYLKASFVSSETFTNSAGIDFYDGKNRNLAFRSISDLCSELYENKSYPLLIASGKVFSDIGFESVNPASTKHVLGRVSLASYSHCDHAIYEAKQSQKVWAAFNVIKRAEVLKKLAKEVENFRMRFIGLLVLEAGKTWLDADAEVSELVDFLNYYADQALKIDDNYDLRSFPGEKNTNKFKPYGVALIIAPWNFPLAILGGMASAALVAGNAIIIKASSQTSIIAYEFITLLTSILRDSLYPPGLVSLLPGDGNTIGEYLVKHKDIRLIAFTGSNQVGKKIQEIAASAVPSKKIIAEMGGKNAIIVDVTADLDEAIPGVMSSTFGYAGQKCSACSRLILEESIYEQFIERFKTAILEMKIGDPQDESTYMGPQIDQKAKNSIQSYIDEAKLNHQMIIGDLAVPQDGFFISPYVFLVDDKTSRIAQEEIFGPVLAVFKARDIGHAIKIANSTSYGLTGAIFSRSPENIKLACDEFETGNLYVNRGSTGAVVSRQAFGGLKNSSVGFKAGGPLYLLQFVQERTITENTMRRGFVAD